MTKKGEGIWLVYADVVIKTFLRPNDSSVSTVVFLIR